MCSHLPPTNVHVEQIWCSHGFRRPLAVLHRFLLLSPPVPDSCLGTPNSSCFSSRHESGWAHHLVELSCSGSTGTETCLNPGGCAQSLNLSRSTGPRGQGPELSLVAGSLWFSSSLLLPLQSAGLTRHELCASVNRDPVGPE